ncbi:MAG TPA: cell division protein ZapA [Saprospiraceae bacterium]|nr:cell division protein ZapA [Saprospiraceae bacterium]
MSEPEYKRLELTIAGRTYPIKVNGDEEKQVRDIENRLNKQIRQFQLQYKERDKLDSVIMALLTESFEHSKKDQSPADTQQVEKKLDQLDRLLDSALVL